MSKPAQFDITREHTIWCNRCNVWLELRQRSKATFIRFCRQEGWVIREGKTLCSRCLKEHNAGAAWNEVGSRR